MNPNLARIGEKAKAHPTPVFTSLYHHIADIEYLRACYELLKGNKAVGVDEVTKSIYAADLEANLQDLSRNSPMLIAKRSSPRIRAPSTLKKTSSRPFTTASSTSLRRHSAM